MAEMLRKRDTLRIPLTHWLLILAVMGTLIAGGMDFEMQLESAIHREMVLGDLKGAIERYKAILAQPALSRPVAARAVFQLGECLEKSGQRQGAYAAYVRVTREYGDQGEVAGQARALLAVWEKPVSGPRNLNFEEGVVGKVPPGWFVPALPRDANHLAELRRTGCRSRIGCAVVLVPPNAPTPLGNLMQSFGAAAYRGKRVRLRAWLRLEDQGPDEQPGARLGIWELLRPSRAQMWLSVDRASRRPGFFDNMDDRPVRSTDWTRCEIATPIDDDATFINFGVMSIGRGRVWVDDVSFETVP